MLPGKASEGPGVRSGDARDRERPAPVGAAIGEGLDQRVLDPRAESAAFAELVVGVRAAVHEGGQAVAHTFLGRVLRGPRGDQLSQLGAVVLTKPLEHATTDYADEGARTRQIAQVVVETDVLRRDPDGRRLTAERRGGRRWRLGRQFAGD